MKASLLTSLLFLAALGACSKKMEKSVAASERKINEVAKSTAELKEETSTVVQTLKSNNLKDFRLSSFEALDEKKGLGEKMLAAQNFFRSFEYQKWNPGITYSDVYSRDELLKDAAAEFVLTTMDLFSRVSGRTKSPDKNNDKLTFHALAGMMDEIDKNQEENVIKHPNFKVISFYDLVKKTLFQNKNGKPMVGYQEILGSEIEMLTSLVHARGVTFISLALDDMTDSRKKNWWQKISSTAFDISFGFIGGKDLPEVYSKANEATKLKIRHNLEEAVKVRTLMIELEKEFKLDKELMSALKQIHKKLSSKEDKSDPHRKAICDLLLQLPLAK